MTTGTGEAADGLLPEEDEEEHTRFAEALRKSLQPEGVRECALAARIIELAWRLRQAREREEERG